MGLFPVAGGGNAGESRSLSRPSGQAGADGSIGAFHLPAPGAETRFPYERYRFFTPRRECGR